MPDAPDEIEGQDLAEVFDEENTTPDGDDIASDVEPDVYDMTASDEDADDALAPQDDFDPDAADEAELEEVVMAEEDLDEPRAFASDAAERVTDDDLQPDDFEPGTEAPGQDAEDRAAEKADLDRRLDRALEATFPASDPVAITPGAR